MAIDRLGAMQEMLLFLILISSYSIFYVPIAREKIKVPIKKIFIMSIIALLDVSVIFMFIMALRDNVTLTNAIAMLNAPFLLIFILILSRIKPGLVEKHPPRVYAIRFLGAIVMYFAAVKIVLQ